MPLGSARTRAGSFLEDMASLCVVGVVCAFCEIPFGIPFVFSNLRWKVDDVAPSKGGIRLYSTVFQMLPVFSGIRIPFHVFSCIHSLGLGTFLIFLEKMIFGAGG